MSACLVTDPVAVVVEARRASALGVPPDRGGPAQLGELLGRNPAGVEIGVGEVETRRDVRSGHGRLQVMPKIGTCSNLGTVHGAVRRGHDRATPAIVKNTFYQREGDPGGYRGDRRGCAHTDRQARRRARGPARRRDPRRRAGRAARPGRPRARGGRAGRRRLRDAGGRAVEQRHQDRVAARRPALPGGLPHARRPVRFRAARGPPDRRPHRGRRDQRRRRLRGGGHVARAAARRTWAPRSGRRGRTPGTSTCRTSSSPRSG